ncbi:hypothetical protein [Listeria aquatica]|uniref:Uncharacterized protein n=1 Tax=Listeria aquatica FSL S10-1188 TaxID=1265818 RepID=W7BNE4_9LIST|nr:hypothetical protein [Listeria aquatica]EUJ21568.1 hypothetical protein MAQA_02552 [Listeria aquatica FSL S10-1188]
MVIVFKIVVVVFSYLICSICAKNIFDLQRELNGLNIALVIVLGYIFMANLPLTFAYFIIWDTVNYYFLFQIAIILVLNLGFLLIRHNKGMIYFSSLLGIGAGLYNVHLFVTVLILNP